MVGGLAGCLGGRPRETPPRTSSRNTDGATATATAADETRPEPVRCEGSSISVERSVTDEPGYDDGIEYFPENGTVRFVTHVSGGDPAGFDTWSFEEWGRIRSASVGKRPVQQAAVDRLGMRKGLGSGIGRPPPSTSARPPVIHLTLTTSLDEDGEVHSTPTASLSELAAAAPESADVTLTLDGDEYARAVPVFAEAVTIRPA